MNCPTDGTTLVLADRTGIEIDHCPVCRGVWLDRGELDKLIERADGLDTNGFVRGQRRDHHDDDDGDRSHPLGSNSSKRKRKSFLGDLFEFGS